MQTQTFRRQHEALSILSAQLHEAMQNLDTLADASDCSRVLSRLTGVLGLHLAAEDRSLYPRLMTSNDELVAQTAQEFAEEMGGLSKIYSTFEATWRSGVAIYADPEGFRVEARMVLEALENRITKENDVLYPLVEQLSEAIRGNAA